MPPYLLAVLAALMAPASGHVIFSNQVFTFTPSSFLRLNLTWPTNRPWIISFSFRTLDPQGVLLYLGAPNDELYVMLENGQVLITQPFSHMDQPLYIGKGLTDDKWHDVKLQIDAPVKSLSITLDGEQKSMELHILQLTSSVLYLGGLDLDDPTWSQQFNYIPFTGCLGSLNVQHGPRPLAILQVVTTAADGCMDLCNNPDGPPPCHNGGRCINYYSHFACDCFGSTFQGPHCDQRAKWSFEDIATYTFYGHSYLSYRMYDWSDKSHRHQNRFSITFKTATDSSLLLHSYSESQQLTLALVSGTLQLEVDFGDRPLLASLGESLHDNKWHNATIFHSGRTVMLILDSRESRSLQISGPSYHLYLDPTLYIAGLPHSLTVSTRVSPGGSLRIRESRKFMGCLRLLYYNEINILEKIGTSATSFHGPLPLKYGCEFVDLVPVTMSWPEAHIILPFSGRLELGLSLRSVDSTAVLFSGPLLPKGKGGFWQVELINGVPAFLLRDPSLHIEWSFKLDIIPLVTNIWHNVYLYLSEKQVILQVDSHRESYNATETVKFDPEVTIGTSTVNASRGFRGCIHSITLNRDHFDTRHLDNVKHSRVTLDNCEFVDPCNNQSVCEHGGVCSVMDGKTVCNCSDTGYYGTTCHFSDHYRSCKDMFMIGYEKNGEYTLDIDKDGPLPPATVYCNMEAGNIFTRVEHNLVNETIRVLDLSGFSLNITYKDFTHEMLRAFIKYSAKCSQNITYDCYNAKLGLGTHFWLKSVNSPRYIETLGTRAARRCECVDTHSCYNASLACNCDSGARTWLRDDGNFIRPTDIAVTQVYALPPPDLGPESLGRLTLGPLECTDPDTQIYVITYKTAHSFLEVPSWRRGELFFSFRTSNSSAILLYQTGYRGEHSYFRILLTSDHEVSFEYTVGRSPTSVKLLSHRKLNTGMWNQVWVTYDKHSLHFTVNLDTEKEEYHEEVDVGPFEGPMYLGGVPRAYSGSSKVKEGFIGCFRGLVMNNEIVNLYKYLTNRSVDIAKDCHPSCSPNPCQNGASCHEHWGSYTCVCVNPVAHSGKNCQHNINANGMRFLTPSSYFHHTTDGNDTNPLLKQNFLLSFRTYEADALLLYVFDHHNNFCQLHLAGGKTIILTFNIKREIVQTNVTVPGISRGKPVQIQVERSPRGIELSVEDRMSFLPRPVQLLREYFQDPWVNGQELETVHPARGSYPTIPHSELFLGGLGSGVHSSFNGLVGCLQGLQIGNNLFDLKSAALDKKSSHGALVSDCKMLCDRQPCHHNGICMEDWRDNVTTCNCSFTSYTGKNCQQDVGAHLDSHSHIIYNLDPTAFDIHSVNIKVAFSNDKEMRNKKLLLYLQMGTSYIMIGLQPKGVLFIEDSTEEVYTTVIKREGSLDDNFRHWLQYRRTNTDVTITLDEKEYYASRESSPSFVPETSRHYIQLGGSMEDWTHYEGCMSALEIQVEDQRVLPLEVLFGPQDHLDRARLEVTGDAVEKPCAQFAEVTFRETEGMVLEPEKQKAKWVPQPPKMARYDPPSESKETLQLRAIKKDSIFIGMIIGICLLVLVVCLAIYLWCLERNYRRRTQHKAAASITYIDIAGRKSRKVGEPNGDNASNLYVTVSPRLVPDTPDLEWDQCSETTQLMGVYPAQPQSTPRQENRRNEVASTNMTPRRKNPPPVPPKPKLRPTM